jgi:hypothetical protein
LVIAIAAAALVLVIGAATAFGQDAPTVDPSIGGRASGVSGSTVASPPDVAVSSGFVAPSWCCGTPSGVPGLTTYGQANMDDEGPAARDAAIAAAVQDATAQANAAADAAGIQLGAIIDMQVSAMPIVYPMGKPTTGMPPGSPGGTGGMEPVTGVAADFASFFGSVSVTITWSIG